MTYKMQASNFPLISPIYSFPYTSFFQGLPSFSSGHTDANLPEEGSADSAHRKPKRRESPWHYWIRTVMASLTRKRRRRALSCNILITVRCVDTKCTEISNKTLVAKHKDRESNFRAKHASGAFGPRAD